MCKSSTQTVYSKSEKKGHYNCCQSMHSVQECSMGPSASETKTAQSVALSPQCYHIRTSLAGKFLIYAVIFSHFSPPSFSSCHCWYGHGFNIQMPVCKGVCTCAIHTPITSLLFPHLEHSQNDQIIQWSVQCVCVQRGYRHCSCGNSKQEVHAGKCKKKRPAPCGCYQQYDYVWMYRRSVYIYVCELVRLM